MAEIIKCPSLPPPPPQQNDAGAATAGITTIRVLFFSSSSFFFVTIAFLTKTFHQSEPYFSNFSQMKWLGDLYVNSVTDSLHHCYMAIFEIMLYQFTWKISVVSHKINIRLWSRHPFVLKIEWLQYVTFFPKLFILNH